MGGEGQVAQFLGVRVKPVYVVLLLALKWLYKSHHTFSWFVRDLVFVEGTVSTVFGKLQWNLLPFVIHWH